MPSKLVNTINDIESELLLAVVVIGKGRSKHTYLSYRQAESSCDWDRARLYRPSEGESTKR